MDRFRAALAIATAVVGLGAVQPLSADTGGPAVERYNVVFAGSETAEGFSVEIGREGALALVASAGGTVVRDLTREIGAVTAVSTSSSFADTLQASDAVVAVAEDFRWKAYPTLDEAVAAGTLTVLGPEDAPECPPDDPSCPPGGPEPHADPFEPLQWNMEMIRAPQAHVEEAGSPLVEVGILDTGIDSAHLDFVDEGMTNVNCAKGRDMVPEGPGVGLPTPCTDNNFHGTHVAGIVAARANEHGVVGAAPNVELIPVKVCDSTGYCYASATAAGIAWAAANRFEVINMSFFVDDDQLLESHEFKCMNEDTQRMFRLMNERAIQYARNQGVVPVAALGNSDNDLAHPPEPYENNCDVVPAETQGVIGTVALGPDSEKAYYSNYGTGAADVSAPGGNSDNQGELPGPCGNQILSTIPGNVWGCFQGTSMASPHAAGVAALIVSQFGRVRYDSAGVPVDVEMRPTTVESYLQGTAIDLVSAETTGDTLTGYDQCFGNGRIDAVRAIAHETAAARQAVVPCPAALD